MGCLYTVNLSNPVTNGAEESVVVSEVSSFQRLKCTQEWTCPQLKAEHTALSSAVQVWTTDARYPDAKLAKQRTSHTKSDS